MSAFVGMNMLEHRKHKSIKGFYFCMYEVYKQIAIKKDMPYKHKKYLETKVYECSHGV